MKYFTGFGIITRMLSAANSWAGLQTFTVSIAIPTIGDTTLSGTPVIITILDQSTNTPYYFKAYPVKP